MSPKKTYVAVYGRDPEDDAWNVHVQDLDGCQTYGRSLRQAQARIREALGLWLDRDSQQLVIRDELPADLSAVADTRGPRPPRRRARRHESSGGNDPRRKAAHGPRTQPS
jgi:predicted RNase H-like HicB family nuclease